MTGKPIPCGKDAPTEAKWNDELLAHRRAELEYYKKLSKDAPEVQKDVLNFLDGYLKKTFDAPEAPSWDALEKQGDGLSAGGAKDPFFLSTLSTVKTQLEKIKEGNALAKSAYAEISATEYPTFMKLKACARCRPLGPRTPFENDPWQDNMKETLRLILELLRETADQAKEQKFVWNEIGPYFLTQRDDYAKKAQKTFFDAVEKAEKVHPWTKNMIEGFYYDSLAWQLRGPGYANTVTEEGWRGFKENIEKASACFTKAWELDPSVPIAAAEMVYVVNSGAESKLSPRQWFDRAVQARFDYDRAYQVFAHHLTPQWHGSHQEMFKFGLECLGTKRFDTEVPFQLIKILVYIDGQLGGKGEIWQEEDVYDKVKIVLETLEKELPHYHQIAAKGITPEWVLTLHGVIAAKAGKYEDARKAFDKVGMKLQPKAFSFAHAHFPLDGTRVYALTGAGRKDVEKIEGIVTAGGMNDPTMATSIGELLDKAAAATKEPQARSYFNHWKTYLRWREQFEKGEWVELTFDPNFSMWQMKSGTWHCETPQSAVCDAHYLDTFNNELCCEVPFDGPLEIELDVADLDQELTYLSGVMLGELWDLSHDKTGCYFYNCAASNAHGVQVPRAKINHYATDSQLSNHLRIQAWDGAFLWYFNDLEFPIQPVAEMTLGNKIILAGTKSLGPLGRTRFANVRVRKLSAPPPPMEKGANRLAYFDGLIAERPQEGFLYYQRGLYRISRKQWPEAEADLKKALSLSTEIPYAHLALSQVEISQKNYASAVEEVDRYLKIKPEDLKAHNYQGWTLSTCRDEKVRNGKLAVEHARKACELTNYEDANYLDTLAAACAENGDFNEAVKWQSKAVEIAPARRKPSLTTKLDLYKSRKPYHEK
ncbi:MAG: tetratricopeptide repeat protein [Pirellulales bacterium]|nr:tetratricopeptide repeat protein [Pirellulales bacterium]